VTCVWWRRRGADASFVEAPRDEAELREIGRRTRGPRVCNMLEGGVTPLLTPDELAVRPPSPCRSAGTPPAL